MAETAFPDPARPPDDVGDLERLLAVKLPPSIRARVRGGV